MKYTIYLYLYTELTDCVRYLILDVGLIKFAAFDVSIFGVRIPSRMPLAVIHSALIFR